MKKELTMFLMELAEIYPIPASRNGEVVIDNYVEYLLGGIYNKKINWKSVKHYIFDNYKKSNFPEIAVIKDALHKAIVTEYSKCKDEGQLVIITLANGYKYSFTVSAVGRTHKEIERDFKSRYGKCDFSIYPVGTVLIGNQIVQI